MASKDKLISYEGESGLWKQKLSTTALLRTLHMWPPANPYCDVIDYQGCLTAYFEWAEAYDSKVSDCCTASPPSIAF